MNTFLKLCSVISIFLFVSCATSKTYVPSQTSTTQRTGFLENERIDVVFFDSRSEKDASAEVQNAVLEHLRNTYPAASFQKINSSEYFSSPENGKVTLKINVAGYNAGFGVESTSGIGSINGQPFVFSGVADGKWNGLTGLGVMLYDYRDGEDKYTQEISDVVTKPNTGGYSTARNALQSSFQNVMNGLASFLDQSLME
jgi:hypothetical protein